MAEDNRHVPVWGATKKRTSRRRMLDAPEPALEVEPEPSVLAWGERRPRSNTRRRRRQYGRIGSDEGSLGSSLLAGGSDQLSAPPTDIPGLPGGQDRTVPAQEPRIYGRESGWRDPGDADAGRQPSPTFPPATRAVACSWPWAWSRISQGILGPDLTIYGAKGTFIKCENPFRDDAGPRRFSPYSSRQNDQPRLEIDPQGDYLDNAGVHDASRDRGFEWLPPTIRRGRYQTGPPPLDVPGLDLNPPDPGPSAGWMGAEDAQEEVIDIDDEPPPMMEIPGPSRLRIDGWPREFNVCGFRPPGHIITDYHIPTPDSGRMSPGLMDLIISDCEFWNQDANGSYKPGSHVRFNTRNLGHEPLQGDMFLRIGYLYRARDDKGSFKEFHIAGSMDLFELVTDNKTWEPISSLRIPGPKTEDLIPWQHSFSSTSPGDLVSPEAHFHREPMALAMCVLLRRKSTGKHNHPCQKIDWYPFDAHDRTVRPLVEEGDFLLRFGVENLQITPLNPNSPEVYGCAEIFKSVIDTGYLYWMYLGRDECWLRSAWDIGLVRRRDPDSGELNSEFVRDYDRPAARRPFGT